METLTIKTEGTVGMSDTSPSDVLRINNGTVGNNPNVPLMTFMQDGEVIGKLWAKDGQLSFEGDADASAQVFFDEVIRLANQ